MAVTFQLRPEYVGNYHGGMIVYGRQYLSYNVQAALTAGGGTITTSDEELVRALRAYEPLVQTGDTGTPLDLGPDTRLRSLSVGNGLDEDGMALEVQLNNEPYPRWRVDGDGSMHTGDGTTAPLAGIDVVYEALNVEKYEAGPGKTAAENSAALTAALAAIPVAGGDLLIPRGFSYNTTLTLTDGVRLLGTGSQQRWRSTKSGTKLTYTGTGRAVLVQNPSGGNRESIEIHNIRFDGTGLSGNVDGMFIDGLAGGATDYVECIKLVDAAFTNFPRYQLVLDGLIIDVVCDRCAFNNVGTPNSNALVRSLQTGGANEIVTQLTLNDCLLAQYGTEASAGVGAWCYHGQATDLRVWGGTYTTNGQTGGSGIWAHETALQLNGAHIEGIPASKTGVGIRRTGANASVIAPSDCSSFTDGIQIGDTSNRTVAAVDTIVQGMVGGNTNDVRVVYGGSRRGTKLIGIGESTGSPAVVVDERRTNDGTFELLWMHSTGAQVLPRVAAASAPNNSLYSSTSDGKLYFKDNSGVSNALY